MPLVDRRSEVRSLEVTQENTKEKKREWQSLMMVGEKEQLRSLDKKMETEPMKKELTRNLEWVLRVREKTREYEGEKKKMIAVPEPAPIMGCSLNDDCTRM